MKHRWMTAEEKKRLRREIEAARHPEIIVLPPGYAEGATVQPNMSQRYVPEMEV